MDFIKKYADDNLSFKQIIYEVLYAAGYVILGYLIIICTRALVIFIEHKVMPELTKRIISSKVVLKDEFLKTENERNEYFNKYEEQRKLVRQYSKDFDLQTEQLTKQNNEITIRQNLIGELQNKIKVVEELNSNLLSDINEQKNKIESFEKEIKQLKEINENLHNDLETSTDLFDDFFQRTKSIPEKILRKINEIRKANQWDNFLIFMNYNNGTLGSMNNNIDIEMEKLGLTIINNHNNSSARPNLLAYIIFKYHLKNITQ